MAMGRVPKMATVGRRFVEALIGRLENDAAAGQPVAVFHSALTKCLAEAEFHDGPPAPRQDPTEISDLAEALASTPGDDPLGVIVQDVARLTRWYPLTNKGGIRPPWDPAIADGMAATMTIGPYAPVHQNAVRGGLFLIRPGVHYPLHTHVSPEVYIGISGQITIQHGVSGETHRVGAGGYSVTPSECVHSLTTSDEAALLAFLWTGPFNEPIWWWHADGAAQSGWSRTRWERSALGTWEMGESEALSLEGIGAYQD